MIGSVYLVESCKSSAGYILPFRTA